MLKSFEFCPPASATSDRLRDDAAYSQITRLGCGTVVGEI
jgi:hypothetical protein